MLNVGEQIVSSYLRYIRKCDFVETNIYIERQGEIDVIGLNRTENKVYVCEVTVQLEDGFSLLKNDGRADTINRFTNKFARNIEHAHKHLHQFDHHFMYWCPIVRTTGRTPETTQIRLLAAGQANIRERYGVEIECIINEWFQECLQEMRDFAKTQTRQLPCPLMRFMQIEEYLRKRIAK